MLNVLEKCAREALNRETQDEEVFKHLAKGLKRPKPELKGVSAG